MGGRSRVHQRNPLCTKMLLLLMVVDTTHVGFRTLKKQTATRRYLMSVHPAEPVRGGRHQGASTNQQVLSSRGHVRGYFLLCCSWLCLFRLLEGTKQNPESSVLREHKRGYRPVRGVGRWYIAMLFRSGGVPPTWEGGASPAPSCPPGQGGGSIPSRSCPTWTWEEWFPPSRC